MVNPTPKYILVEKRIRKAIKDKTYRDKLPGERMLAKELGFSYMTIRKAIDNLVNEGLLYKVPTKGTYIADRRAQTRKNRTIGFFLDSSIETGLSSPYYSLIFNALERHASRHGYSVVYFSENNEQWLQKTLPKLDGVIATCFPRVEGIIQEMKLHLPVVVIDNSATDKSIPSVIYDNFNAEIESLDYICSLGHKRIGFMMGLEDSDIGKSRYAGYQHGLKKHGINLDKELVFKGNYSFQSGINGGKYFTSIEQPPTAILCANDSMALGAIQILKQKGLHIPGDMSIIGFDDIDVASQVSPALTTVAAPVKDMATLSFDLLQNLILNRQSEKQHIVLTTKLAIRETCANLSQETGYPVRMNGTRNYYQAPT